MHSQESLLSADCEGHGNISNRRLLSKQQTRKKVLSAARRLFSECGYEGATIRDIAAEAGMSTGAVFDHFKNKAHLLREIMLADMAELARAMRKAALCGRDVEDALLRAFSVGYAFHKSQLHLARAAFSVSWLPGDSVELRFSPAAIALRDLIDEQVQLAITRGELSRGAEVTQRVEMLFDCYFANYPEAILLGWGAEALQIKARGQIRIILAGARQL
ncbi:MAG: helix-turn-helix domain-containing protein [Phenylobacterium sp.]|uniref:TetR/AcrR family transcriptional regulator n=1 Tax=Phenylobacterium sp. TaxID=1871053 RepID=UPI003BB5C41A